MRNKYAKIGETERRELEYIFQKVAADKNVLGPFLEDLLSPAEIHEFVARLQIVKLLSGGASLREVAKTLKVSIATVARGAQALANSKGGFNFILNKNWWRPKIRGVSPA